MEKNKMKVQISLKFPPQITDHISPDDDIDHVNQYPSFSLFFQLFVWFVKLQSNFNVFGGCRTPPAPDSAPLLFKVWLIGIW